MLNECSFKSHTEPWGSATSHFAEDVKRTLWVDAIRINQADNEGKECEVARMCSIYFNCRQAIHAQKPDPRNI